MIIYVTKKTAERFGIDMSMDGVPEPNASIIKALLERDTGSLLREWGANLFYFNGKKCLQVVNFASKFTLFIFDIKKSELQYIGSAIMGYLFTLFEGDDEMIECLERMQRHDMIAIFEPLKNKSMIATLNHNMQDFAWDGEFQNVGGFNLRGRLRRELELPARQCSVCAYRISGKGGFVLREVEVRSPADRRAYG